MPLARETATQPAVYHERLGLETREALAFVDMTDRLRDIVHRSGVVDGLLTVQSRHTTAGIMINEHEPLLLDDLRAMFERLVPAHTPYAHDDFSRRVPNVSTRERRNGYAHCRAALLRASESVAIVGGRLALGRWQRIFFVDFDGGQQREVAATILASPTPET